MAQTTQGRGRWCSKLYKKAYAIEAWDWKEDPRPYIRALYRPFGIRASVAGLDPRSPERLIRAITRKHSLHMYNVPGLEGSDVCGFIVSKEKLSAREIQKIEADYWGEDFGDVYDPTKSSP